jgi:hypothetical protein
LILTVFLLLSTFVLLSLAATCGIGYIGTPYLFVPMFFFSLSDITRSSRSVAFQKGEDLGIILISFNHLVGFCNTKEKTFFVVDPCPWKSVRAHLRSWRSALTGSLAERLDLTGFTTIKYPETMIDEQFKLFMETSCSAVTPVSPATPAPVALVLE